MRHWLVIDLEATTDEGGWPLRDMEIIEIGASLATLEGHEIGHFQRYVRPLRRPCLTSFCKDLTHIAQPQIDSARTLAQLWPDFESWLQAQGTRLAGWASWGDYDRRQLEQEWQAQGLHSRLQQYPHLNLKQSFASRRQLSRPVGLNVALSLAGMHFQGRQHRALEDARNAARLLPLALPH
ncbi:MAG TPA: exonuclease domain-containing protein [Pseudomonas sp.]|jgi:inhibitor of KinA sporulation pathway (predicted exonuclease)|uniref:exonuclease domain-containing protein n=1 Tax=Pseudomonas sp. TaxID=306 RepID=UPI002CFDABD1|nr:exonuclease domain-containing protein [Pseudomonas sp.]HTO17788.1 exonuclease domain-containing protein [Pseudomonas sp.]